MGSVFWLVGVGMMGFVFHCLRSNENESLANNRILQLQKLELQRSNDQLQSFRVSLDDKKDIVNCKFGNKLIRRLGHRCAVVSNGRDAISFLNENSVDIVLMDYQMEGMSGLETASSIRGLV